MNPMYFVIGCPRSGTYLLSNMLNQSGRIAIPTETHFVPLFQRHAWLFGDLGSERARARLLDSIYAFLEIWLLRAEEEREYKRIVRYSLLATRERFGDIVRDSRSYPDLVHGIFREYARLAGMDLCGDKSAFADAQPLELIDAATAGAARFIHIVRDGRDVFLSWRKTRPGPRNVAGAAAAWRRHVLDKRRWGRANPGRYHELRYEDLLAEPEAALRGVCGFMGIDYTPAMLEFHKAEMAREIADSNTHKLLASPVDPANRGKWRDAMQPADAALFEHVAGDALRESGYPPAEVAGAGSGAAALRLASWAGRARHCISYNATRVRLKNLLPLALMLGRRVGLRLERMVNSRGWLAAEMGDSPPR